jgi:tetratricopeptide (TPR) repeat protein
MDFDRFDFDEEEEDALQEPYPDYFFEWDAALSDHRGVRFLEAEELCDIVEIYLNEGEADKAQETIARALQLHPDNEDLIHDLLLVLSEFDMWNEMLALIERYQLSEPWFDGHKISALLHLGMEEDAFFVFREAQQRYEEDHRQLFAIYHAMSEALQDVDLRDASLRVIMEAVERLGPSLEFYWLQLQIYFSAGEKEKTLEMATQIEHIDPMGGETWNRLGILYFDLEEMDKSIEAFEFAESLGVNRQSNYIGLITAYEQNGNLLKALEKAREYVHLYSDTYMSYILAANVCSELKLWQEAVDYINEVLQMMPEQDFLYLHKSQFLLHLGERQKAISALEEGIRQTQDKQGELKKALDKLHNEFPEK